MNLTRKGILEDSKPKQDVRKRFVKVLRYILPVEYFKASAKIKLDKNGEYCRYVF